MNTYRIQEREAGNVIESGLTYETAVARLEYFEAIDRKENCFVPHFYEIVCEQS